MLERFEKERIRGGSFFRGDKHQTVLGRFVYVKVSTGTFFRGDCAEAFKEVIIKYGHFAEVMVLGL